MRGIVTDDARQIAERITQEPGFMPSDVVTLARAYLALLDEHDGTVLFRDCGEAKERRLEAELVRVRALGDQLADDLREHGCGERCTAGVGQHGNHLAAWRKEQHG